MLGTLYGVQMLKIIPTQVKMLMEESPYSEKWYWREASLFNTLKAWMEVWCEQYAECKTITEKKDFGLFIMEKMKEIDETLKKIEVKLE